MSNTGERSARKVAMVLAAVLLVAACGADDDSADDDFDDGVPPATVPASDQTPDSTSRPDALADAVQATDQAERSEVGAAIPAGATWQWQLQDDVNTSYDVDVYDIDLFDTPTAVIDSLHADGRTVICYYSAGSFEAWRDDADRYPAVALGEPLDGWEDERWIDIRDATVRSIIEARHDLAVEKGCDGVEPDNVTAFDNNTGFELTAADQLDFNRFLASSGHARELLVALKNDLSQIEQLVDDFDFAVNEECVEYEECEVYAPFVEAGKAVLNAEYATRFVDEPERACSVAAEAGLSTLILPVDLDDSFRFSC